ncbi:MAG TPA: beta-propeller domain-containing protein [Patescibacteria group bacterium]|nr:beta-propeller domain-containing protein [Patescibacteria group bacterium]
MSNTPKWFVRTLIFVAVFGLLGYSTNTFAAKINKKPVVAPKPVAQSSKTIAKKVVKFASAKDFKKYLTNAQKVDLSSGRSVGINSPFMATESAGVAQDSVAMKAAPAPAPAAERFSTTNVQVAGIDEPDVVKTDGSNIFYSHGNYYPYHRLGGLPTPVPMTVTEEVPTSGSGSASSGSAPSAKMIAPDYYPRTSVTDIVKAFPAINLAKLSKIDKQGDLLLSGNILLVLSYEGIFAYNISNLSAPVEAWQMKYKDTNLVTARMQGGKVYLVLRDNVSLDDGCVIKPFVLRNAELSIKCTEIYHPTFINGETTVFHAMSLNPQDGKIASRVSFMGAGYSSIVYANEQNMYVSYNMPSSQVKTAADFLKTKAVDVIGKDGITRINKVMAYDIEDSSKLTEVQKVLEKALAKFSEDEGLKKKNELNNRLNEYLQTKLREIDKTGIVRISLKSMTISGVTEFAGRPLNQFAFDEWQGHLRVAATINPNIYLYGQNYSLSGRGESVSDVTVFDTNLNIASAVQNLGKTEQIYAVRFIGPRGYVVTFRQIDPFYVLDLSNPKNAYLAGELKIPGFSSYLHPLDTNLLLGVGQENGKVKLSLFNISDSANPREVDKYYLEDYWTEVSSNHHAFLQDAKHSLFFMPGGQGGYVFGYAGSNLSLLKAYKDWNVKRALYIDDAMYFITDTKIAAFDEKTWEKVAELDIAGTGTPIGSPCPPDMMCIMDKAAQ